MLDNSEPISFCACMGKIGNDPYCPCEMKSRGLEPTNLWTEEEKARLHAALDSMFNKTPEDNQNILPTGANLV